jgi:DNA-binding transcriptional LysR family regulator
MKQLTPSLNSISARLRFKQLNFLIALADCGSLHKVAEQMLGEIETTFSAKLFVRSSQGMQANELGECVVRYARLLQSDLGQLREEFTGVLTGRGAKLRIGAIAGALPAVVIPAITKLQQLQPTLSISIREDTSAALLTALDEGKLDLAICRTTVASDQDRYDYEGLCEEQVAVVVGAKNALKNAKKVSLEQLAKLSWIVYPSLMPLRNLLEREFKQAGLPLPEYTIETSSIYVTLLLLQERSNVVALLNAENMEFCARYGLVHKLQINIKSRTESYGIVTRRDHVLSPIGQLMAAQMRMQSVKTS